MKVLLIFVLTCLVGFSIANSVSMKQRIKALEDASYGAWNLVNNTDHSLYVVVSNGAVTLTEVQDATKTR